VVMPRHKPTDLTRKTVRALSAYGVPHEKIALTLGIVHDTLVKYYKKELDTASSEACAKVAESLFRKATGDGPQSVAAAIFWLKTRARWRETSTIEEAAPGIEFVIVKPQRERDA